MTQLKPGEKDSLSIITQAGGESQILRLVVHGYLPCRYSIRYCKLVAIACLKVHASLGDRRQARSDHEAKKTV